MSNTFKRTTEEASLYNNIEQFSTEEILSNINKEDQTIAFAVRNVIRIYTLNSNKNICKQNTSFLNN